VTDRSPVDRRRARTSLVFVSNEAATDDERRDFFAAQYPRLAGWVRRQVDDDETAHDIAAEAFTRLMTRWSASHDQHAYLYKTAVNLLRDHWRRARRVYDWIVFTNVTDHPCTLKGYPGVSWVASGRQVNLEATRSVVGAPARVTLAPQESAHAQLHWSTPEMFDDCCPVPIDGYRVYLPDETESVIVPMRGDVCSTDGVDVAQVDPVVE
jgi:hypothetical protein